MKRNKLLAAVFCSAALATSVFAQEAQPPPAPAPAPDAAPAPAQRSGPPALAGPKIGRAFAISDKVSPNKRTVAGKANAVVMVPRDLNEASVTVTLAGKTFSSTTKPYKIEIDTASIPDGEYEATAVAKDSNGTQVWQGKSSVIIDNSGKSGRVSEARPELPAPAPDGQNETPPVVEANQANPPGYQSRPNGDKRKDRQNKAGNRVPGESKNGEIAPIAPAMPTDPDAEPPSPANPDVEPLPGIKPASVNVTEIYESKKLGVKLAYPAGWKVSDHNKELKSKDIADFWVSFSSPEPTPSLTVNFRHKTLKQATTPESFAKYNTYLQQWAKVSVNGKPAFETTQGVEGSARVVHRKMIIDGKHIWMLNCIDQTGKSAMESKGIFEQIVASLIKP